MDALVECEKRGEGVRVNVDNRMRGDEDETSGMRVEREGHEVCQIQSHCICDSWLEIGSGMCRMDKRGWDRVEIDDGDRESERE